MEILGPVFGFGAIIAFIVAGVVIVRRLAPRPSEGVDRMMLEDLHTRLAEVDELKQRVSELEERVDFSERMLAQRSEGPRLGPPQT